MNTQEAKIVLETALICAQEPLKLGELRKLFADGVSADTVRTLLEDLKQDWSGRGVELVGLASGWRFQSKPAMRSYLDVGSRRLELSFLSSLGPDELLFRLTEVNESADEQLLQRSLGLTSREAQVLLWISRGPPSWWKCLKCRSCRWCERLRWK